MGFPIAWLVTVTVAPGTTALLVSRTVPVIVPRESWAKPDTAVPAINANAHATSESALTYAFRRSIRAPPPKRSRNPAPVGGLHMKPTETRSGFKWFLHLFYSFRIAKRRSSPV